MRGGIENNLVTHVWEKPKENQRTTKGKPQKKQKKTKGKQKGHHHLKTLKHEALSVCLLVCMSVCQSD